MEHVPMQQGEILLYNNDGEKECVSVVFQDETFWLTQKGMAELFACSTENVIQHLKNIYAEEELTPEATAKKFLVVRQEGSRQVRRTLEHYNLDAIIAVGYRVNSKKATRFRQWATKTLKEYITRETDKYNSQGTTSTTVSCVIFHALQAALIEETGFQNQQFALIHPGGAVGERLNSL